MQWDMKPTEKIPELSLTLHSLPFFGDGLCKLEWGMSTSCNSYLSCVGLWLSRESHAKFAIPNARQLEHGNHCVCVNVEMNIGTNRVHLRGGRWPT